MKEPKQLSVSAIENGTVIDHIPAKNLFKVISILGLDHIDSQITFGTNLESKKLGKKAIIKISGKYFEDTDINRIALVAPDAKLRARANQIGLRVPSIKPITAPITPVKTTTATVSETIPPSDSDTPTAMAVVMDFGTSVAAICVSNWKMKPKM